MEELYLELNDNEWPLEYINHDRNIVRAIVFDKEMNFYFVRVNRDDDFGKGTFIETSGGGVEYNENLDEAIKRELSEELGVKVKILNKIGIVSDYYNLIHRHNINHYFLCKIEEFGNPHMTDDEINKFHLKMLVLSYEEALKEYERCKTNKLGRILYNREYPVLKKAKEILNENKY